ncbi:MAG TPA: flagellar protein FliT [Pusillimonas sp.]|uniref:flagellar protein FliT n=1 Tax=unclassified Pusillimonas TaxID=2640016 RepID=UPI00262C55DA|nr:MULTISPECIES: flagellar protein FliT [unclassified Pusillimonas]HLU18564.1 flagellar protein FliT [Pusillimonas sp.]
MAESSSIVHHYQQIAEISGQMLKMAQANDWDAVVALSQQYFAAVESLRPLQPLDTDDRLVRKSLLSKILNDDARIRNLAAPEMARLGALLGAMKRHQNVLEAYCNNTPERH